MTELIIIFILWVIATIAGANSLFTLFLIFASLFGLSLRRYLLERKQNERWRELQLRMKGLELNQQQVLKRLHDLEHPAVVAAKEAKPAAAPPATEAAALRFASEAEKKSAGEQPVEPAAKVPTTPAVSEPVVSPPAAPVAPPAPTAPPLAAQKETPAPPAHPDIHPPAPATPPPAAKPVTPHVSPPVVPPHATVPPTAARVTSNIAQPAGMHASGGPSMSFSGYAATPPRPPKPKINLEETILTNLVPKIAITLVVLGIAYILYYEWHVMSALAKIGLGLLSGIAILLLGVFLEKRERYVTLGRVCIGGGWATIFVTTYAMRFFPGSPLLPSDIVGFILLFGVAAAMVFHTLRYRSQLVTGAAFLLAYVTVWVGHDNQIYSLTANALLSAGLIFLVVRYNWFELEVLGILAAYINHFYWLMPIVERVGRHKPFDQFLPSALLLIFYWAIFRGSYLARKVHNDYEEKVSTVAALLNSFGLLAVMKYQSVHPELAFRFLLLLGAVELLLGQLPAIRKRRLAFVMLSTIGASLLMAAFPFRYAPDSTQLSVLWLFEAEVFFFAGIAMREVVFRYLSMLAGLVAAIQILVKQGLASDSDLHRAMVFALAALFFYFNSLVTPRAWKKLVTSRFELTCLRGFSFIASAMAFAAVWVGFSNSWVPVLWAALAVALILGGSYLKNWDLSFQSYGFVTAAFVGVLAYDIDLPYAPVSHFNLRVLRFVLVALAFYLCAWRNHALDRLWAAATRAIHSSLASLLVAVLIWIEFPNSWMAVSWMIFALALATVARYGRLREFSVQSFALALAVLCRIPFHVDLAKPLLGHLSERLVTLGLITIGFYILAWLSSDKEWSFSRYFSYFNTWAAAGLVSLLVWYEVERWPGWIAVAWMMQALLLAAVMDYMTRAQKPAALQFSWQSYLITLAAFARTLLFNFDMPHGEALLNVRLVTVVLVSALLYGCAALRWQRKTIANAIARQTHNYAASLLLVLLGWIEYRNAWVAAIWILFALAAAVVGRYLKLREFSIKSGLLALVAVGRVVVVNLPVEQKWHGMSLRLVTVGIVIAALYAMAPLSRLKEFSLTNHLANLYTWMASGLLMTLVWYEMHDRSPVSIVVVWTLFALVLFEIGMNRPSLHPRLQSYVALGASFVRIFFANLNAFEVPGKISPRIYTVAPLALAFYYVYERLEASGESDTERGFRISQLTSFLGLFTLGAIMRSAMDPERVIIGWTFLAAALVITTVVRKRLVFYYQAVMATAAVAVRATFYNLISGRPMQMDTTHRPAFCVGISVALLFVALPFAFKIREWKSNRGNRILRWIEANPHQIFFFVPLALLTYLLERELSHAMLTTAWGIEGIIVFVVGLSIGVKSYRRSGLVLLLGLCLGKVLFDIFGDPNLSIPNKAVAAVVLGLLLGGVSFLGARYREIIREYL